MLVKLGQDLTTRFLEMLAAQIMKEERRIGMVHDLSKHLHHK
jgi:hypothetical protein